MTMHNVKKRLKAEGFINVKELGLHRGMEMFQALASNNTTVFFTEDEYDSDEFDLVNQFYSLLDLKDHIDSIRYRQLDI